jgi:preprotein translocase subunit SecG
MSFIIGILTVLLVLNCLLLILLVLIQLPKKDAGVGMAFGGGAADALFGAGSGNALTKITKYATVIFFALALFLGHLESRLHQSGSASEFEKQVQQKQMQMPVAQPPSSSQPATAPTNNLLSMPLTSPTSAPVPAPTNMPTATPQSK